VRATSKSVAVHAVVERVGVDVTLVVLHDAISKEDASLGNHSRAVLHPRIVRGNADFIRGVGHGALGLCAAPPRNHVSILTWCRSGKHRSVAMAMFLKAVLEAAGHEVVERLP